MAPLPSMRRDQRLHPGFTHTCWRELGSAPLGLLTARHVLLHQNQAKEDESKFPTEDTNEHLQDQKPNKKLKWRLNPHAIFFFSTFFKLLTHSASIPPALSLPPSTPLSVFQPYFSPCDSLCCATEPRPLPAISTLHLWNPSWLPRPFTAEGLSPAPRGSRGLGGGWVVGGGGAKEASAKKRGGGEAGGRKGG